MAQQSKTYRVKTEFTDSTGKRWKVGDTIPAPKEGEQPNQSLQDAIRAGQVQEAPANTSSD